MFFILIVCCNN